MDLLFQPYEFCGIQLKNRFVRSANMENLATLEKLPSEDLYRLYEELARGKNKYYYRIKVRSRLIQA
jgi:2,4-dienoyl-CoA reductase-like NADH-dependent reductase (Old Yellow Enzyme family)